MPRCDACGNDYAHAFQVVKDGATHTFDSFECAIHKLAPRCSHCGCAVIGHGLEAEDRIYSRGSGSPRARAAAAAATSNGAAFPQDSRSCLRLS